MRNGRKIIVWLAAVTLTILIFQDCTAEHPTALPVTSEVHWITEYNAARLKGIELNRPVLLFVTSERCSFCVKMENDAFSDSQVIGELSEKFVPAKLKLAMDDQLAVDLKIRIFPTVVIISPSGKIIDYARGYLSTNELHHRMRDAVTAENSIASSK